MPREQRCRHDIVAEILEALAEEPMKPAQIARKARLAYDRAAKILASLEERGLIYHDPETNEYHLLEPGYEWLYLYKELAKLYTPPPTTPKNRAQNGQAQ